MKFIGQKKKINRHLSDGRGEHKMPCEDVFLRRATMTGGYRHENATTKTKQLVSSLFPCF
jgi:hypothetical protein